MAIIPPRLDDRAFDDLRAELIRRIPIHAPEWTDHITTYSVPHNNAIESYFSS